MNAIEFWILRCAIDNAVDVKLLAEPRWECWEAQNRPRGVNNEEIASEEIVSALDALFRKGDLCPCTKKDQQNHFGELIGIPPPTQTEILHSMTTPGQFLGYWLTASGGSSWEKVAQPRWDQFQNNSFDDGDENQCYWVTIEALEAEVVESYVLEAQAGGTLIEGTVERKDLVPWEATYWKTFAKGYYVRYQEQGWNPRGPSRGSWYQVPQEFR